MLWKRVSVFFCKVYIYITIFFSVSFSNSDEPVFHGVSVDNSFKFDLPPHLIIHSTTIKLTETIGQGFSLCRLRIVDYSYSYLVCLNQKGRLHNEIDNMGALMPRVRECPAKVRELRLQGWEPSAIKGYAPPGKIWNFLTSGECFRGLLTEAFKYMNTCMHICTIRLLNVDFRPCLSTIRNSLAKKFGNSRYLWLTHAYTRWIWYCVQRLPYKISWRRCI